MRTTIYCTTIFLVGSLSGCCALQQEVVLTSYEREQQKCIEDYAYREEAEECVKRVRVIFAPLLEAYEVSE
jgi:hypothetical protein